MRSRRSQQHCLLHMLRDPPVNQDVSGLHVGLLRLDSCPPIRRRTTSPLRTGPRANLHPSPPPTVGAMRSQNTTSNQKLREWSSCAWSLAFPEKEDPAGTQVKLPNQKTDTINPTQYRKTKLKPANKKKNRCQTDQTKEEELTLPFPFVT